jgi:hypothetical protein
MSTATQVPVPGEGSSGALINHPDVDLADPQWNTSGVPWHTLYYKDNYPRLQQVKARSLTRQTRGDGGVQQPALPLRPPLDRGHYPRFPGSARGRCPRCLASATQR